MNIASSSLRIARPVPNLSAAEHFWVAGVGMTELWRTDATAEGEHALLMLGLAGASWHLELVDDPESAAANPPGPEDLLVIYLDGPVPQDLVDRIASAGGEVVAARNPYWDRWGITIMDPSGHLLVLCTRSWP